MMPRSLKILIAWELGGNWGHLATLLPLALCLREAGHTVLFAVRGLDGDVSPLHRHGFDYVASPIAIAPLQNLHSQPVHGYADVLARCGFSDARTLTQLTHAWHGLLRWVQPDIVVCKYAPLAEFATRAYPALSIGTGFGLPPLTTPLPLYSELQRAQQATHTTEAHILNAMQVAAQNCGFVAPVTAGQAFMHVPRVCLSWPALDHFGVRADMDYLGPVGDLSPAHTVGGVAPLEWLHGGHPVSMVYLRLGAMWLHEFVNRVATQFPQRRWLVVDPSLNHDQCRALCSAQVRVVNTPVDWANPDIPGIRFDSLICHGGHGGIVQALSKGLRLMMVPQHTEQLLLARRVLASQVAGAGVAVVRLPVQWDTLGPVMARLLQGPTPVPLAGTDLSHMAPSLATLVQRIETIAYTTHRVQACHV